MKLFDKLKLNKDFLYGYQNSKKWHCDGVVIFYLSTLQRKIGFTASKKAGNAVMRNRYKRRMRAVFFEIQDNLADGIYIFVAKSNLNEISHDKFKKSIHWALKRLGCLKK